MLLNALTVDVEDYFQVSAFETTIDRRSWDTYDSRVVANTQRVLELLDACGVRGTFFVLGWVARRFPDLVRQIHVGGHEIGSHSFWHRLVYRQNRDEFREDLRESCRVLEDITGERVTTYRAPSFSITRRSRWALEVLVEEGIRCDSSIFPIYHDRYGMPSAEPKIHSIKTPSGSIWEFPPSVMRLGRLHVPVSGGGYFRLYPFAWTRFCLQRVNRTARRPIMFYLHPWELDADQPRLACGSHFSRWRHYLNLGSMERKLQRLIREFRFGRMCDVMEEQGHAASPSHQAENRVAEAGAA